jgi:hypothetical protein
VLCFGFLAPYKGLEVALGASAALRDRVHLVVAGGEHPRLAEAGDSYAASLRERFGAHATFTGYVDDADVGDWFAAGDVAAPVPAPARVERPAGTRAGRRDAGPAVGGAGPLRRRALRPRGRGRPGRARRAAG